MTTFLVIIHVFVCVFLIGVVLLQSGKGAQLGAAFGGSSQTLFGSRGAATFLSKMTTIAAVVFMLTSLMLAVVSAKSGSVVKTAPAAEEKKIPVTSGPVKSTSPQPVLPSQPVPEESGQTQSN
ncbi:MAG: preprotein translocase subunit SecG [Nitrospirota bacterium]